MRALKQTVLAFFFTMAMFAVSGTNAQVPDVCIRKNCEVVFIDPNFGVEIKRCVTEANEFGAYLTAYGELVYVHEHRLVNDKVVFYNALKTQDGNWVEDVSEEEDRDFEDKPAEGGYQNGFTISITDDNGKIVASRFLAPKRK